MGGETGLHKRDLRWIAYAAGCAAKSRHPKYRMAAVIVHDRNFVMSIGVNDNQKTHPKSTTKYRTMHAEFHALRGLKTTETVGATIYVARITRDGVLACSWPCPACLGDIHTAGIERVCFITEAGQIRLHQMGLEVAA